MERMKGKESSCDGAINAMLNGGKVVVVSCISKVSGIRKSITGYLLPSKDGGRRELLCRIVRERDRTMTEERYNCLAIAFIR